MAGAPLQVYVYRQQRERANTPTPLESGPAREAAANPPVPRAWVDTGQGAEVLIEHRADGVFATGTRQPGKDPTMWSGSPQPVEGGFSLPADLNATPDDQIPTLKMSDMQQVQTGPDFATRVSADIMQGIGETLTGQTLEYGARQAVSGVLALASDARDALAGAIPDDVRQTLGIAESVRLEDWVPEMAPPESVTGNIVSALSQFLIPYGAVMKGVSVAGKAATTIGGRSGQAMGVGAAVDFTVWDTQDERFADLVQTIPWAANDIMAWLASNEDDSALESRLKNSVEGALLGGLLDGIVNAARIYRAGKQMVDKLGPDVTRRVMDDVGRFAADESGTVQIPDGMMPPSLRGANAPGAGDAGAALPDAAGRDAAGVVPGTEPPTSLQDVQTTTPRQVAPEIAAENVRLTALFEEHVAADPRSRDNQGGLAPHLRTTADLAPDVVLPKAVPQDTKVGNAERSFAQVDEALAMVRGQEMTVETWGRAMAHVTGSPEVPVAPTRLIAQMQDVDGWAEDMGRLTPSQLRNVEAGLADAAIMGDLYRSGRVLPEDTSSLLLWSFLSKGVDPFTQEGMFLDVLSRGQREGLKAEIAPWIRLALDGGFTKDKVAEYIAWAEGVARKGSGLAGAGTAHNLNAFGDFLQKMGEPGADGISHLQTLHNMIADGTPSRDIRRWFHSSVQGVGIDNKVLSFTLLAAGRTDVVILDRVQIRNMFDDGRFAGINIYDGKKVGSAALTGTSFAPATTGARGLAIYEMIEEALLGKLGELGDRLGREMTPGRFHWESWVLKSEQEVDHATLGALRKNIEARGSGQNSPPWANVYVRQGKHATFNYGVRYGVDMDGTRHYIYETSDGAEYVFTPTEWMEARDAFSNPKSGVIPEGFGVKRHTDAPWVDDPVVNREKLDGIIQEYGTPLEGQRGDGANVQPGDAGASRGRRGGAAVLAGGSGAAVLAGGAGQDALASGEQYDAQGNLIVNVVPNPDVPTRPGDLTPAVGGETQVAGAAGEAIDALARALNGNVEARAAGVLGKAIDDKVFSDLRSAMDTPAMDDVGVALGAFNYAALTTTGQIDDLFAAVTERFATGIDSMVGSQPRQALAEMQTTVEGMRQKLADLTSPTPSAEVQTLTQTQRDIAQIELVAQVRDLEQRIERGRAAEGGVMTDDTVAWMADATGLNAERLINRQTGEAYNAPQLRAARAIVTGALDDMRALHAEALVSRSPDDIALLRRTATITAALLLQYKGATAEAARALGSLRGNAAMPPGMNASTIPNTPLMQSILLRDYFEASGGMAVNERFLEMMTEALKEPNEALLANFVRKAKGASTMDMLAEAWINSLLGSPTTHAVNFASNAALTGAMMAERWAGALGRFGGTGPTHSPMSAMAYTTALVVAIPDAVRLALRSTVSSHYSSKFTTSTREAAITAENIGNLATRDTGRPISDGIDHTVGTVLKAAGHLLPRRMLETGGPLATVTDFLAEYYYRGPGRLLGGADEFFKVVNYRAALAEFAYMQAMAEGLTGRAFSDRMVDIIRNPETQAPDIHLSSIDHSRYATLQLEPTPMMVAMGRLRSTIPGGRVIVPFLNIIGNITRVAYHRAPGFGMLTGDNMRRLQSGSAADRQVVAGRQIMGLGLLGSGGLMAAAGLITGRLTDDYSQEQALEAAGVQPYSINIGALMGGADYWISYDRTEPIGMFLAIAADTAQVMAYVDSEEDASAAAVAAMLAVEQYMLDKSFLQGVSDLFAVADPRFQSGFASAEGFVRYAANIFATAPGAVFGPAAFGTPLSANLMRNVDDTRRSARPDPSQTLAYRLWEQTINRIMSRTPGLSSDLPPRYNWLGRELRYEAAGPDLISPFRYLEGEYDSRPLIDMGIDPGRARILDLTGMQIGFEGEPSTDIPRERWAEFIKAVGIEGEMIRLGITPTLPPRKISGIELTPEQDSIYAYLRGQGVKIRGDGGYMTAQTPDGEPVPLRIPMSASGGPLYPGLEGSKFYTMEEMLEAVIATPEYRDNLSDYSDGAGMRGMDQKAELIREIMGIYTSEAPGGPAMFGARLALFTLYPDLARDVFARRFNLDPANVELTKAQQFLGMQP